MNEIFKDLSGKRVLITGSSRGIGKALAIGFAQCGADIVLHGTKLTDALLNTYEEIRKLSSKVLYVCGDLSVEDDVERIYKESKEGLGGIDILICNVSLQIRKPWMEVTYEEADKQLKINFTSTMKLIQLCAPDMMKNKWGRIITIGSVQQVKPHPDMLIYSASKAAIVNMTKSLALQLAEYNITVNNIAPGTIYTDRNTQALSDKAYCETVKNGIPMKKIGEPEDCVGIALVMGSEMGKYITGEDVCIDGGRHI